MYRNLLNNLFVHQDIVEAMEKANKLEDEEIHKGLSPNEKNKA